MITRSSLTCPHCGRQLDVRAVVLSDDTIRIELVQEPQCLSS